MTLESAGALPLTRLCLLLGPWFDWAKKSRQHVLYEFHPPVPQQHGAFDCLLPNG